MNLKKCFILLMLLCCVFLLACNPKSFRANPEFESRLKDLSEPALIPPDIKIYEFTAGGVREQRDDWSLIGKNNVQKALVEVMKEKNFSLKNVQLDKQTEEELEDIQALYRAVSLSVLIHTYGNYAFETKKNKFDYSIGSIQNILQKLNSTSMIFVHGSDEISTSGRKALTALGFLTGIVPRPGQTFATVAIIDASGNLLWYNANISQGNNDLRDYDSTKRFLDRILANYPNNK